MLGLFVCLGAVACKKEGEASSRRLVLTGSSTIAPLMLEIGKRFEAQHPGVRVDVQTGGSSRGIRDAREGLADLGMVSRALKPEEADLQAFTVARDGICLIVHRDNPIKALGEAQVRALFRGERKDWGELGGVGQVTVVHKAEGRSTLELFLAHYGLSNPEVKADVIIGDNEQGIRTVAGNPGAIGYVSIGSAEYNAHEAGVPIRLLPVGGVEASTAHVKDGSFPLARPLNLVTSEAPEGLTLAFLDFARSAAVHDLIKDQYFVPLSP